MEGLARNVEPVTPSSSRLPNGTAMGLYIAVAGNLSYTAKGGGSSGVIAVVAQQTIPVMVDYVLPATTATVLAYYE